MKLDKIKFYFCIYFIDHDVQLTVLLLSLAM